MPRLYQRVTQCGLTYTGAVLQQVVKSTLEGMPLRIAAVEFSVLRTTIRHHLQGHVKQPGGQTVFSKEQDNITKERTEGFPLA
jgi:hypothetical protein